MNLSLSNFDECECGDYRMQHNHNGEGVCEVCKWDTTYEKVPCEKFRLARIAKDIPIEYQKYNNE